MHTARMLIDLPQNVLKAMLMFVSPQDILHMKKEQDMLIDLPQDVLKAVLIFVSPQDIIRLRKVCRYLNDFIKVCRRELPMPGVNRLKILAPSTGDPDHWKFIVEYTAAEPSEQRSVKRKIHGINSLNLPIEKKFWVDHWRQRHRSRSCTVPTSRLNEMVQELCQFRHSRLRIGRFGGQDTIWTDLCSLLQMLNDVYGECPTLRPGTVYFECVDLTTVSMVDWRTFLAKMNTQGNKRYFEMIGCIIPHLDYGLPSLSTSRLLNSIGRYYDYNNSLTGTGQPDLSQMMDVLQNLMLRPPGMDKYKCIHLGNALLTASQWIGLIEAWKNGVDRVAVDSTAANEDHRSLFLETRSSDPNGNAIFRQMTQHFNCKLACLVIDKPRSKQLLIVFEYDGMINLAMLRFAQPWHRQSRTLEQMEEGGYVDEWIFDSIRAVYWAQQHLALYRRMKELGIMSEKDRRFMSGEEE